MKNIFYGSLICIIIACLISQWVEAAPEIFIKPYIGSVRILLDEQGQTTTFVVPMMDDEKSRQHVTQQQAWKKPHSTMYLTNLRTEENPDTRRHLLFELGFAIDDQAQAMWPELIAMMTAEPDENVRVAYISCLSALATQAGLSDAEILDILAAIQLRMQQDESWKVKVHAASILVWFGDESGTMILDDALTQDRELEQSALDVIPITLQRLNNDRANALLKMLAVEAQNENLRLSALWSAYQMDFVTQHELLQGVETLAKTAHDPRAKLRGMTTLYAIAQEAPALSEQIQKMIQDVLNHETDEHLLKQMHLLEQQAKEGRYGCQ